LQPVEPGSTFHVWTFGEIPKEEEIMPKLAFLATRIH
jgi:hypothetical protein